MRTVDSNDNHLHQNAGMGKIGRSYSRFDDALVEDPDDPTRASRVAGGLVALLVALGVVGLLLSFWPR
jgi:hypothetical protein